MPEFPALPLGGLTRRHFLLGSAAVGAVVLAGCGADDGDDAADGGGADGPDGGTPEEGGFPVTIAHRYGETTVESAPQRVFVAGLTDIDAVLALGVTPVGFIDWYGDYPAADIRDSLWPWAHELGDGKDMVVLPRNDDVLDIEAIAATNPDLVIAQYSNMSQEEYDSLSRLCPVVAQHVDFELFQAPWDATTEVIGRAVGRPDQAAELIAGVGDAFEAARAAHPSLAGASGLLISFDGGIVYARGPEEPHGKVLAELGMVYPANIQALIPSDNVLAELSLEQLGLLEESDVVIVGDTSGALADNALYQSLELVQQGRVVPGVEPVEGALYWATVLSLPYAVERLAPMLAAALDADPATPVPDPAP